MVKRNLAGIILVAWSVCMPLKAASAHPIHMSYTEVKYIPATKSLEISLRVYANDFSAAAARHARVRLKSDSLVDLRSALSYIRGNLLIASAVGPVSLVPCGVTRSQDMLRFCFRAKVTDGSSTRLRNSIMTELFADQVNVVQSVSTKGRTSKLFVRGDTAKPLGL